MGKWRGGVRGVRGVRGVLTITGVVLCLVLAGVPLASVRGAEVVRVGQAPAARVEPKLGRTAAAQTLTVALPLTVDKAAMDAAIARMYDPKAPEYGKHLTPKEFTDRFVNGAARGEVETYLRGQGLSVTSGNTGSLVTASGTAVQVERAFSVELSDYRAADGRAFYAADQAPALPPTIAGRVTGVIGLESAEQDRSHAVPLPPPAEGARTEAPRTPVACSAAVSVANRTGTYTANQISAAYHFPFAVPGFRQTVALYELDDYRDANVNAYQTCFGTTVPVGRVINGPAPVLGSGETEVELDIDIVAGMAPNLASLFVYETQNDTSDATALFQRIANDNAAQVVSTSWGNCELRRSSTILSARYTIFAQMAAQGMSMFAAAGDNGSQDCGGTDTRLAVDEPASQPYVTGVGGTRLQLDANSMYGSEAVWNNRGATGGGTSAVFTRPTFQDAVTTSAMRQVPDVAANADPATGYVVYTHSPTYCPSYTGVSGSTDCFIPFGGTSAAAPLWAVATAIINEYDLDSQGVRVGFANATYYRLHATPFAFNDITVGNNCYLGPTCGTAGAGQYPATPGYDLTTGLGSFQVSGIASDLVPVTPTITIFSPNQGTTAGGYPVQITGTNFLPGTTVQFGDVPSPSVTVVSQSVITAVAPVHDPGNVSITVTVPGGKTGTGRFFTYVAPPVPTALNPTSGVNVGGTVVNIYGFSFQSGATVTIGGVPATNVTLVNGNQIAFRTPPGKVGMANVVVTNPDGQSGTLANGFTYTGPVITGVSATTVSGGGGGTFTITGSGFQPGAVVAFGGDQGANGTNVQVNGGGTQLTLTLPIHRQGLADVVVGNPDGSTATLTLGVQFIGHPQAPVSGVAPGAAPSPHTAAPTSPAGTPLPQPVSH